MYQRALFNSSLPTHNDSHQVQCLHCSDVGQALAIVCSPMEETAIGLHSDLGECPPNLNYACSFILITSQVAPLHGVN